MYSYDEQIAYLTANPSKIMVQWAGAEGIFKFAGSPMAEDGSGDSEGIEHGCLTMIRNNPLRNKVFINGQINEELSQLVAADERLPKRVEEIEVRHLPIFKEWQERIDLLVKT